MAKTFRSALKALSATAVVLALSVLPATAPLTEASAAQKKPIKSAKAAKAAKYTRTAKRPPRKVVVRAVPRPPSLGQLTGLHATQDALDLKSSIALVIDQDTDEVLFSKNASAVLPIASITKLMRALVVTEARLPLDEVLTVTSVDAAVRAGSSRQLRAGARLTRGEMLHLALMASETE